MKKNIIIIVATIIFIISTILGITYFNNKKFIEYPMNSIQNSKSVKIISYSDEKNCEIVSIDDGNEITRFNSYFYLAPLKSVDEVSNSQWIYKLYFEYSSKDVKEVMVYSDYISINGENYKFAEYEPYLQKNLLNMLHDYYNIIFEEYKTTNK